MGAHKLSETEFQVVLALAGGSRHGYGILQEIPRQTGGRIRIGPGTLYGAIKRLRAAGFVTEGAAPRGAGDDARRTCYYRLTPTGRAAASEAARRMADWVAVAAGLGLLTPTLNR